MISQFYIIRLFYNNYYVAYNFNTLYQDKNLGIHCRKFSSTKKYNDDETEWSLIEKQREEIIHKDEEVLRKDGYFLLPAKEIIHLQDLSKKIGINWERDGKWTFITLGEIGEYKDVEFTEYKKLYEFKMNAIKLKKIFDDLDKDKSYAIAFLLKSKKNKSIVTLDNHLLINYNTPVLPLLERIYSRIDLLSLKYDIEPYDILIVKFRPLREKVVNSRYNIVPELDELERIIPTIKTIKGEKDFPKLLQKDVIPHTMDISKFGKIISKDEKGILFDNTKVWLLVSDIKESEHKVKVIKPEEIGKTIAQFIDQKSEDGGFIRTFTESNVRVMFDKHDRYKNLEYDVNVDFLSPRKKSAKKDKKILTFDIESYIDNVDGVEKSVAFACGFYDGKKSYLYYVTDYKSDYDMLLTCLRDMIYKYNNYTIYCHNFGKFDVNFIHKILHEHFDVGTPSSKDLNILSIPVRSIKEEGKKSTKVVFSDSFRLLPSSLEKLAISFNVPTLKGYFPYNFVNSKNLNYVGPTPDFSFYTDTTSKNKMSKSEYDKIKSNKWSLKEETLKYLEKDLVSLHQVLNNMIDFTFKSFGVNITKVKTISALAFYIYRSNFLIDKKTEKNKVKDIVVKYKLPKLKGQVSKAVREAYYGGRNEIFVPMGNDLLAYDFNSLYPTAMMMPMPIGMPIYSQCKDLNKIFGFVKAEIITPGINIPVLPCRVNVFGTEKLIFPIGQWTGWYFSEELKLAVEYGYTVNILESYIFEKNDDCFREYVNTFAEIKDKSSGAMREISKLLMNSLYGRTGMKDNADVIRYVSSEEAERILLTHNVIDNFPVKENLEYIRYHKLPSRELCDQSGQDYDALVLKIMEENDGYTDNCLSVAAATASWARILMYKHILNSAYTDTDSIYVENALDPELIGKGIGKFKGEYGGQRIKQAIFPSPKLYLLELENGEIISKRKGFTDDLTKEEYLDLYSGSEVDVIDTRWKRNLQTGTVRIFDQKMTIGSLYDKREKIYSLGKWVSTSPLCINSSFKIVTKALTKYKK